MGPNGPMRCRSWRDDLDTAPAYAADVLIPPALLSSRWSSHPRTIVHVGGHRAEELEDYLAAGWGSGGVLWVEAMSGAVDSIRERIAKFPNHRVVHAVVWSESNVRLRFHETSNGQSSSVLGLKTHADHYPDIIVVREEDRNTTTLADLIDWHEMPEIDLLNLDIQGAELHALQGLGSKISCVNSIYSEINTEELYEGCALLDELDGWLAHHNFVRVDAEFTGQGWGDGFWIRRDCLPLLWRTRWLRRHTPEHLIRKRNAVLAWGSRLAVRLRLR